MGDIDRQKHLDTFENVWICEFCLHHNSIPLAYRPPNVDNPCILVEKAKKGKGKEGDGENKMLIFCIDISGSMDFVFEGKSRLESVKEAIKDEVNRMKF